jgi:hypothetical protein
MKYDDMQEGDIFRWKYNKETLKGMQSSIDAGTLYWCVSQIAVFRSGFLVDTYWRTNSEYLRFDQESIEGALELEYLGNFHDLEKIPDRIEHYYSASDVVNLNHPNSSRDNVYIKKGSKKNLEKMKALLQCDIEQAEEKLQYYSREIERLKYLQDNITVDDYINIPEWIPFEVQQM